MGKMRKLRKIKLTGEARQNRQKPELQISKQKMPRKLTEMVERKKLYESGGKRAVRRKMKEQMIEASGEDDSERQRRKHARKRRGESDFGYLRRLEAEVSMTIKKTKIAAQQEPEKKVDKVQQLTGKRQKAKKRFENLKNKRQKKVQDRTEEERERDRWTDKIEFGEVVTQPPTLTFKPRKAEATKKPGQRDLLLKKRFSKPKSPQLSLARAKVLDDERERVIKAYRDMKNRNGSAQLPP